MKKIFIVSGEVSGDKLGAWYLQQLQKNGEQVECTAVGGKFLASSGAKIYERMENLNISGGVEILRHLISIFSFLNKLANFILENNYDEIVLVDFPGFNLRLAQKLKRSNPNINIVYLSPPQLWIWGEWRIKKLKKFCDKLIVLHPFEVEWYKQRGIEAQFWGNPVYSFLKPYISDLLEQKENQIALVLGSRKSEIENLLPVFISVVKRFKALWPKLKIILPLAESFSKSYIETKLKKAGFLQWGTDIIIVQGEQEKLKELKKCCLALTKPGTVTLELALLQVPAVVIYKTSWITYLIAKSLVKIKLMSLANLLLGKEVYKEFIQQNCSPDLIFAHASQIYKNYLNKSDEYKKIQTNLLPLKKSLMQNL